MRQDGTSIKSLTIKVLIPGRTDRFNPVTIDDKKLRAEFVRALATAMQSKMCYAPMCDLPSFLATVVHTNGKKTQYDLNGHGTLWKHRENSCQAYAGDPRKLLALLRGICQVQVRKTISFLTG